MSSYPTNTDDVIDSRDVIEAIEELAERRDFGPREASALASLVALAAQGADYAADWQYGATLIRDSYFEDYAEQLAEDVCEMPSDVRWPYTHIDWAAAAEELQQDYTSIDFDGVTYWVR